jgi:hypothetical protein
MAAAAGAVNRAETAGLQMFICESIDPYFLTTAGLSG